MVDCPRPGRINNENKDFAIDVYKKNLSFCDASRSCNLSRGVEPQQIYSFHIFKSAFPASIVPFFQLFFNFYTN